MFDKNRILPKLYVHTKGVPETPKNLIAPSHTKAVVGLGTL